MQRLSEHTLDDIFLQNKIPIRLACVSNVGYPSVLSLWYTILHGKVYCATKKNSRVVKFLENNNLCGFEIAADAPPYKGIRGRGIASIRPEMGKSILALLIEKYLGNHTSKLSKYLSENSEDEVAIEISPQHVSLYDYSKRMSDVKW